MCIAAMLHTRCSRLSCDDEKREFDQALSSSCPYTPYNYIYIYIFIHDIKLTHKLKMPSQDSILCFRYFSTLLFVNIKQVPGSSLIAQCSCKTINQSDPFPVPNHLRLS